MLEGTRVLLVITVIVIRAHLINTQHRCINPNQRSGICVSIYGCSSLLSVISRQPLTNTDRQFLVESQCIRGMGTQPHVCCTEGTEYVSERSNVAYRTNVKRIQKPLDNGNGNVLPKPGLCGRETTGNRIYGGNATELDEFPWLALLLYRTASGTLSPSCGGSLINQRYVLTAAHCVSGDILNEVGPLNSIRLGEYDIFKDIDCIDRDCAEPVIDVYFDEIVVHENFDPNLNHRHHDIALIRLTHDVPYTDFIRPVCLPFTLNFQKSNPGSSVTVAGWGRTLGASQSQIKQKLTIPVSDQSECSKKFSHKKVNIIDSQLCAGGIYTEDTCDGDSGGPLMRFVNNYWAVEGIISFGNRCGLQGWPAVYTRVFSYEAWIKRHLRP